MIRDVNGVVLYLSSCVASRLGMTRLVQAIRVKEFCMSKGIREKSADTSILENRLRNTSPGDVIPYAELSTILGRDVREFCRGNLNTARKNLVGEKIHFDVISGEGLKRLDGVGAVDSAGSYIGKAKRAAGKGIKILQNVEFENLPPESRRSHLAKSAQLGAIKLFGSNLAAKKIEEKVGESQLAIGETLKLFGG